MTSAELFLNIDHYESVLHERFTQYPNLYEKELTQTKTFFHYVSVDTLSRLEDLSSAILNEANLNCKIGTFSAMISVYGLSSAIGIQVQSLYSPSGSKYCTLFTTLVKPRIIRSTRKPIVILWSVTSKKFANPNHFVLCIAKELNIPTTTSNDKSKSKKRRTQTKLSFEPLTKKERLPPSRIPSTAMPTAQPSTDESTASPSIAEPTTSISTAMPTAQPATDESTASPSIAEPTTSISIAKPTAQPSTDESTASPSIAEPTTSTSTAKPTAQPLIAESTASSSIVEPSKKSSRKKVCKKPCCTNPTPRGEPVRPRESCDPNDIGLKFETIRNSNDDEKFEFIQKTWNPPNGYSFPQHFQNDRHWRFSSQCIIEGSENYFEWIRYSEYYDGAFCLPCVLFGNSTGQHNLGKLLITEPYTRWNGAFPRWRSHQSSQFHLTNNALLKSFKDRMENKSLGIDQLVDSQRRKLVEENRKKLLPIVKSVIFCGRQNIAFRGHRESQKFKDKDKNTGNFRALLDFRIESGDKDLESHFGNSPKNAMYLSPETQNQIIKCCGQVIESHIVDEVKAAKFFSIIADEASDSSQTEQLSLCLRYVNKFGTIKEDFIRFIECEKVDAASLVGYLKIALKDLSLNFSHIRGQGYDGAGCMAGHKSGVSTRILKENPKALYFHCSSHRLNLVVASCTNIRGIKRMMDTISKLSQVFHYSPKKLALLRKQIEELIKGKEKRTTLLDICRTRWCARFDALERIQELIEPILVTLNLIAENHDGSYNAEARQDANGLYSHIKTFSFGVHFIIVRQVLSYMVPLTFELQKVQLDVLEVYKAVDTVTKSLADCIDTMDATHHEWYEEAVEWSKKYLDADPCLKRIAGQTTLRENYSTDDPETYFRVALTKPLVDRYSVELRSRFTENHRIHTEGEYLIPKTVLADASWKDHVNKFVVNYRDDLPQPLNLSTELREWEIYWKSEQQSKKKIPDSVTEVLSFLGLSRWFPNIRTMLCIVAVAPSSSNSCERSISRLRLIKTHLRANMTTERLSNLALMSIHRNIEIDPEEVLDIFSSKFPHRMLLH